MTEISTSLVMKNDYNNYSESQRVAMLRTLKPFLSKLSVEAGSSHNNNTALNNDQKKIVLADFGCSAGKNSLLSAEILFQTLKKSHPEAIFQAFLSDLPGNDFNKVIQAYQSSSLVDEKDFFFAISPGSFYQQIFPDNSVQIATCFTAVHWLSHLIQLK